MSTAEIQNRIRQYIDEQIADYDEDEDKDTIAIDSYHIYQRNVPEDVARAVGVPAPVLFDDDGNMVNFGGSSSGTNQRASSGSRHASGGGSLYSHGRFSVNIIGEQYMFKRQRNHELSCIWESLAIVFAYIAE